MTSATMTTEPMHGNPVGGRHLLPLLRNQG